MAERESATYLIFNTDIIVYFFFKYEFIPSYVPSEMSLKEAIRSIEV